MIHKDIQMTLQEKGFHWVMSRSGEYDIYAGTERFFSNLPELFAVGLLRYRPPVLYFLPPPSPNGVWPIKLQQPFQSRFTLH